MCVYKQSHSCVSRQILQHIVCDDSFLCVETHSCAPGLIVRWTDFEHIVYTLQHTATHCNILQHTATHCNTLQHTATHCNTLQHEQTSKTSCTQTNYTHFHTDTDCLTTSKKLSVVCCKSKDRVTLLSISIILWIHFVLVIAGWGGLLQMLQLLPVA